MWSIFRMSMFVKTLERNWKMDSNTHVVCLCLWTLLGYKSENYNALSSSLLYNLITFFIGLSQKKQKSKKINWYYQFKYIHILIFLGLRKIWLFVVKKHNRAEIKDAQKSNKDFWSSGIRALWFVCTLKKFKSTAF